MAENNQVTTTNSTMGDVTERISSKAIAQSMILKYANTLLNKERAGQFYAQVALIMRNNIQLAKADPQSLFSSMMACVHLDLMPNTPEGYAYIIPYKDQAQFQLGYKGLVELAYRSGVVKSVNAELVFPEDEFRVELGTERKLVHNPSFNVPDRGNYDKADGVYATAQMSNGEVIFEYMTKSQIEKVRAVSQSGNTGPWGKWADQMARKTVLKRLLKLLPSSTEDNRFKVALELDSRGEAGKRINVDTKTGQFIDSDIVADVKASPDKKAAILAANGVVPANVDTTTGEITEEEPEAAPVAAPVKPSKPAAPKKSVKEQAKDWSDRHKAEAEAKQATQATLVDDEEEEAPDDNRSRNNPGQ